MVIVQVKTKMRKLAKQNTGIRLIKKANKLVESRYKFDIWQMRIFICILAQINKDDEDFKVYRIWFKDLIKTFGLKSAQSYAFFREAAKALMRKVFYVTGYEDGQKRETEYHIIRSVNYLAEGEKGGDNQEYIDITIDPDMKPLLLQLGKNYKGEKGEDFTAYDLRNVIKLGAYHVRIYELLKQYQTIGYRTLGVEDIKRMLEITTEYPLFGNFFQKVIKPSIAAINKHTDLNVVKVEKIKKGKKVIALYFEYKNKKKDELKLVQSKVEESKPNITLTNKEESREDGIFNKYHKVVVEDFGVTPSVFMSLIKSVNDEQVEMAMRVTRRMKANNEIKKSVAGFFIKALNEGYTDSKEEERKKKLLEKEEVSKNMEFQIQLKLLKQEKRKEENRKIGELTTLNPQIADNAILAVRKMASSRIKSKEQELGRSLIKEDYRHDEILAGLVINKIKELNKGYFIEINQQYNEKVVALKKKYD